MRYIPAEKLKLKNDEMISKIPLGSGDRIYFVRTPRNNSFRIDESVSIYRGIGVILRLGKRGKDAQEQSFPLQNVAPF